MYPSFSSIQNSDVDRISSKPTADVRQVPPINTSHPVYSSGRQRSPSLSPLSSTSTSARDRDHRNHPLTSHNTKSTVLLPPISELLPDMKSRSRSATCLPLQNIIPHTQLQQPSPLSATHSQTPVPACYNTNEQQQPQQYSGYYVRHESAPNQVSPYVNSIPTPPLSRYPYQNGPSGPTSGPGSESPLMVQPQYYNFMVSPSNPPQGYALSYPVYQQPIQTPELQPVAKKRRSNLPKPVTNYLMKWFSDHLSHPYPTDEEKAHLMRHTGLTASQISNWFINARRRKVVGLLQQQHLQQSRQRSRSETGSALSSPDRNQLDDGRRRSNNSGPYGEVKSIHDLVDNDETSSSNSHQHRT